MPFLSTTLTLLIALPSAISLSHSAQSIPKLRHYEDKAEKAAKWSNTAEKRLKDTRYTVAAGLAISLVSLISAVYYALFAAAGRAFYEMLSFGGLSVAAFAAAGLMRGFWKKEKKVPGLGQYNEAIAHSGRVMGLVDLLGWSWGLVAVMRLLGL